MKKILFMSFLFITISAYAQTYSYDNANRLTQINYSNGLAITYSYDKLGNRISQQVTASTPLPIALSSFSAEAKACWATLYWHSGWQEDLTGYELESSSDGNSYKRIALIALKKDGNYSYNDEQITEKGYRYYRLKLLSKNGNYQYSQTLSVYTDCANPLQFTVAPNPATDDITVSFFAEENEHFILTLYDVQGHKISSKKIVGSGKSITVPYSLLGLPPAVYHLQLQNSKQIIGTQKIEKL